MKSEPRKGRLFPMMSPVMSIFMN